MNDSDFQNFIANNSSTIQLIGLNVQPYEKEKEEEKVVLNDD